MKLKQKIDKIGWHIHTTRLHIIVEPDIEVIIEGSPVDVVGMAAKIKDYLENKGLEPKVEIEP